MKFLLKLDVPVTPNKGSYSHKDIIEGEDAISALTDWLKNGNAATKGDNELFIQIFKDRRRS
jgi:hypothetical protein